MIRSVQRRFVKPGFFAVVAASVLAGAPGIALAAEFHAILTRFGNAPRAQAHVEVSLDTTQLAAGPTDVFFDVFDANGSQLTTFSVRVNEEGFASSAFAPAPNDNLFSLSGGEPALVRARTPSGSLGATATLHQRESGHSLVVSVPKDRRSDGTPVHVGRNFMLHVGEIRGTASILVANVSGADVTADVFVGTTGAGGTGKYNNPRIPNRQTWRLDLQPDDQNANLVLATDGDVVVQLVIDDGRLDALTVLPTAL